MNGLQNGLHFLFFCINKKEINNTMYRIGHIVLNIQLGGVNFDLFNLLYHILLYIIII